jgi:hypothetical protein
MIKFTQELQQEIKKLIDAHERVETVEFEGLRIVQEPNNIIRIEFLMRGEPMAFLHSPLVAVDDAVTISGVKIKTAITRHYESGRD